MNVLETFYFLFDSDAKKLDKGLADSTKSTDKLEKGLQEADKQAAGLGSAFVDLAGKAAFALGALFSVSAISASVREVNEFVDALGDSADALGVNVSQLHAWENAVRLSDGEAGAFTSSLKTVNAEFNSIATKGTGRMLPFLKDLGLGLDDIKEASKDPMQGLLKMSDAFSKLNAAEAAGLGQKIGLDQGTINLLRQGRVGVEDLIREQMRAGVITKEQKEEFDKYNRALIEMDVAYQDIKRQLVTQIIPALTWFLRAARDTTDWAKENKGVIAGFFAILTPLVVAYGSAAMAAGIKSLMLYGPIIASVAAVVLFSAALALVTEDLYQFGLGNKSVTGDIVESWGAFGEALGLMIDGMGKSLVFMIVALNAFGQFASDLFNDTLVNAVNTFGDSISDLVQDITQQFPILQQLFKMLENSSQIVFGFKALSGGLNGLDSLMGNAKAQVGATSTPLSSQSFNVIAAGKGGARSSSVKTGPITINTQATDAKGIAKDLGGYLDKYLQGTIDQTDDGVKA